MKVNYTGSGKVFLGEKEYDCDLYLNEEQGGILLKINVYGKIANYLELPIEMDFISGELSTGFRFTLLECTRKKLQDLISYGKSVFSYSVRYMIKGIGGKAAHQIAFNKIVFQLSDTIEWGNISGYSVGENYQLKQENETECILYQSDYFSVKYFVNCSMLPVSNLELLKENITLNQNGNIEISFNEEKYIKEFEDIYKKVKRLIEFSMLRTITLKKVTGWSKDNKRLIGKEEHEWPIEIISYDCFVDSLDEGMKSIRYKWICLPELIENNSFEKYFQKYGTLEPVVELYLEILEARNMSSVRAFLNITQALETYHARFKANTLRDFKQRIKEIMLKNRPESCYKGDTDFLLKGSEKTLTLQSRLADLLLAEFKIWIDTGDISRFEFPRVIAKTRNYYTHYNESIKNKERVLTREELGVYNRVLLYMLEYHLLSELGFTNTDEIREKLNDRWGKISESLSIEKESRKMFGQKTEENKDSHEE